MDAAPARRPLLQRALDTAITLLLWVYFLGGFVFLPPVYIAAHLLGARGERTIQRLNSRFYRGFFALVRVLMPGHRWRVRPEVRAVRSSVVVCNHVSYLDSILMISLFDRHTTLVKGRLFDIPVFGTMLRWAGYIPAAAEGRLAGLMVERVERLRDFLAAGGNLFVFPEGTRSRDGRIGRFSSGAFKVARHCGAPIRVVSIRNTDRMFRPGSFAFDTRGPNTVHVELVGTLEPSAHASTAAVMEAVRAMLAAAAGPAAAADPISLTSAGTDAQP